MIDIPISPNLDCKSFDEYNLLLVKVEGKAGICEEYCFNLRFEPIGESKLDCSELLNTEISFSIRGWDSSTASDDPFYYSGIISNVKKHSPTLEKGLYYSVVVRPVIWRLRRNKRSRVFYDLYLRSLRIMDLKIMNLNFKMSILLWKLVCSTMKLILISFQD